MHTHGCEIPTLNRYTCIGIKTFSVSWMEEDIGDSVPFTATKNLKESRKYRKLQ